MRRSRPDAKTRKTHSRMRCASLQWALLISSTAAQLDTAHRIGIGRCERSLTAGLIHVLNTGYEERPELPARSLLCTTERTRRATSRTLNDPHRSGVSLFRPAVSA